MPPPDSASADPALHALTGLLEEQRRALHTLSYRLTVASLLVAKGDDRHVARAADDIVAAAERVGELELARAVTTMELAAAWNMDTDQPTLRQVIDAAPDDHRQALESHLTELRGLSEAAFELAGAGRQLVGAAAGRVDGAIGRLEAMGDSGPYGPNAADSPSSAFFDGTA